MTILIDSIQRIVVDRDNVLLYILDANKILKCILVILRCKLFTQNIVKKRRITTDDKNKCLSSKQHIFTKFQHICAFSQSFRYISEFLVVVVTTSLT